MRILFIGDIFGKPGREIVRRAVPALIERESLDFVIANVENSAAGFGVTGDIADTILGYGVDAMTTGNHVWDKKEVLDYIPRQPKLLRPANFPGRRARPRQLPRPDAQRRADRRDQRHGTHLHAAARRSVRHRAARRSRRCARKARVIIVDFHAEATSEKVAMGWHLDGRVTAVFGTHTHVQTADDRILPEGHGVPDRRRDDRPARFDHRRHHRGRARRASSPHAGAVRVGDRARAPERRHRHRGPGDRAGRPRSSA